MIFESQMLTTVAAGCPSCAAPSSGQRNSLGERLRWCHPTEGCRGRRLSKRGMALSCCSTKLSFVVLAGGRSKK